MKKISDSQYGLPASDLRLSAPLIDRNKFVFQLSAEEEADLQDAEDEAARGEFVTEEDLASLWAKYRG